MAKTSFNMTSNRNATILLIIGWLLFLICLSLPAMQNNADSFLGIDIGLKAIKVLFKFSPDIRWFLFAVSGLGNIFIFFSVFTLFTSNKKYIKTLAIIYFVFSLFSLSYFFMVPVKALGSGYYLWVISFITVTISYTLAYKQSQPEKV